MHKPGPFPSLPSFRPGNETNHLQYVDTALIGIVSAYPSLVKYTCIAANKIEFSLCMLHIIMPPFGTGVQYH